MYNKRNERPGRSASENHDRPAGKKFSKSNDFGKGESFGKKKFNDSSKSDSRSPRKSFGDRDDDFKSSRSSKDFNKKVVLIDQVLTQIVQEVLAVLTKVVRTQEKKEVFHQTDRRMVLVVPLIQIVREFQVD